jgi:hypothetical protein
MKYWQKNSSEFLKETRNRSAMDNQPLMLSQTTTMTSIKLHLTDTKLAQKLIDYTLYEKIEPISKISA